MSLPPLFADVLRRFPPHPPQGGPPPHPFPDASRPPPVSGEGPGLCGLTNHQWHMVMILGILLLVALAIALVISRISGSEISVLWLRVQDRAKLTRMGLRERLFGHLLSEDDILSGLIATGPEITPRRYPTVDFILAQHRATFPNANAT